MAEKDEAHEAFLVRLRKAMDDARVDQRTLAGRLEITEGTISKWFRKGARPRVGTLAKMPDVLGVSVDWLVGAPKALRPNNEAVRHAIDEALRRARASLRAEILRAFDEWDEQQERPRRK